MPQKRIVDLPRKENVMDVGKKLCILKKIAYEFNKADITWALEASMLLYLKGITTEFHDIDLMVTNEDIDLAKHILMHMGSLQPPNPSSKYKTKVFLEFKIEEVDVDVMAGFTIVSEGHSFDCSLKKEQIVESYNLDGERIPLQSIELWCRYYELMGRESKVEMIKLAAGKLSK